MIKLACVAIAGVFLTSTSFAADLGYINQGVLVVEHPSGARDWSGFYAGLNGGYGWLEAQTFAGTFNDFEGAFGGAQFGYNHDFSGFILGVEGDVQLSDIKHFEDFGGGDSSAARLNAFGTLRARAGYAFDNILPYVTAGVAVASVTISGTSGGFTVAIDDTYVGYAIGAGLEVAVADNVSIRGEYLYTDFGKADFGTGFDLHLTSQIARVGVNFHF